MGTYHITTVGY